MNRLGLHPRFQRDASVRHFLRQTRDVRREKLIQCPFQIHRWQAIKAGRQQRAHTGIRSIVTCQIHAAVFKRVLVVERAVGHEIGLNGSRFFA